MVAVRVRIQCRLPEPVNMLLTLSVHSHASLHVLWCSLYNSTQVRLTLQVQVQVQVQPQVARRNGVCCSIAKYLVGRTRLFRAIRSRLPLQLQLSVVQADVLPPLRQAVAIPLRGWPALQSHIHEHRPHSILPDAPACTDNLCRCSSLDNLAGAKPH